MFAVGGLLSADEHQLWFTPAEDGQLTTDLIYNLLN